MAARRALPDRGRLRRPSALGLVGLAALSARLLAAAIALGIAWAAIAAVVHLALLRGLIPSYAFPVAVAVALLDLPLLVGLYIETAIGRGSITFAEVIAASVLSGILLSIALTALVLRVRRAIR